MLNALIEEHAALNRELEAAQEDAKLNLRESVRLQHELSAALEAGHTDRIRTATARDCGALSGADEDEREDEEEGDDNDDGEYEDAEDDDVDDSDASAERLREELLKRGRFVEERDAQATGELQEALKTLRATKTMAEAEEHAARQRQVELAAMRARIDRSAAADRRF